MATTKDMGVTGGSFMTDRVGSQPIFIPELFGEEQLAMAAEAQKFMDKEVLPQERFLESKDGKRARAMVDVLKKACELGLALVEIPEQYDGLGADKVTSLLVTEKLGTNGDFSVTYGAHSGIGLAPILYFGTHAQKQKYVTAIGSGTSVSCYALSEPGSGSDALGARTTAVLNDEGTHYIFNGTKQWITNAAWMDVGVVFAKVDGDKFTGFIVERDTPGLTIGAEEHKLGLRGSSTCQLIFENAPVPVENVLGEVGKGHKIAFNTLNLGRYKLGAGVLALAKRGLKEAIEYATDRKQFRTSVIDFGALRDQVADSVVQIYCGESLVYRIAGAIDARLLDIDPSDDDYVAKQMAAIEEYVVEASTAKVYCSEVLDRVLDRCLQWHGGYGFVEDYNVEKMVRDARVNRIFEGTNEINRILVPGTLLKRTMQGRLDLMKAIGGLEASVAGGSLPTMPEDTGLERAAWAVERLKGLALLGMNAATSKLGNGLQSEQEILVRLADVIMDCYAIDSAIGRTEARVASHGDSYDGVAAACCKVAAYAALDRGSDAVRVVLESLYEGDELATWTSKWQAITGHVPANIVALKKQIAADAVERGGFALSSY